MSDERGFVLLSSFLKVFDNVLIASNILSLLDFVGFNGFISCYRHLFGDPLYNGECAAVPWRIAQFQPQPRRLQFRRKPMTMQQYLYLWHFSIHSLSLRGNSHSFPSYDYPLTCYKRWPAQPSPLLPKTFFSACAFFPPEAPTHFANALVLSDHICAVKIFRQGPDGYHLLMEIPLFSFCVAIAISPLGRTVLLLHNRGEVSALIVTEGGTRLKHKKTLIVFNGPPSTFAKSPFWNETSFVLFDERWNFVHNTLAINERGGHSIIRKNFFVPKLSAPTVLIKPSAGSRLQKYWAPPDESSKPRGLATLEPRFYALSSPPGDDGSCGFLVLKDRCGVDHEAGHCLQIVLLNPSNLPPSGFGVTDDQTYYLSTPNFYIADFVLHPDRRRVYIVGLTRLSQNLFFAFEPQASLTKPEVRCHRRDDEGDSFGEYDSLAIYEVDLRGYSGLPDPPPFLKVEARFYAPTNPRKLASAELLEEPSKERLFARKFGLLRWRTYKASCNRTFLVVRHEEKHFLLFPHAATYPTPPFSLAFLRRSALFASTAEMMYIVTLPRRNYNQEQCQLTVHKMCTSHCAQPSAEEENEYRKIPFVGPPMVVYEVCYE
jgi:hypothetical protein